MPKGILGLDFLPEYNCTIDLSIPVLQIPERGLEVPLQGTHKVHHSSDIELVNAVNIPVRSELEVVAKTRVDVEDGGTWLMEEKSNCKHPALVSRALVSPHKGTVVVHLLNPHSTQGYSGCTPPQSSLRIHNFTWKSNNRRAN